MVAVIVGFTVAIMLVIATVCGIEIYRKLHRLNEAKKELSAVVKKMIDNQPTMSFAELAKLSGESDE